MGIYIMKRPTKKYKTSIRCNEGFAGMSLERKIEQNLTEGTPLDSLAPLQFTKKKEGVKPEFDPRTDIWEIAQAGMKRVTEKQQTDETPTEETPETDEKPKE